MSDKDVLDEFRAAGALLDGHFILSSGLRSAAYLQCARVLMNPARAARLAAALAGRLPAAVRDGVELGDPAGAARLTAAVRQAGVDDVAAVVAALLALPGLLPDGAGTHPGLVTAATGHAHALAAGEFDHEEGNRS